MAGQNQFYPIATDASANVLSNASWQASNVRQTGFKSGIMPSNGLNVALRQGTALSSAIGGFIAAQGFDALDNGDLATLQANFKAALISGTAAAPIGKGLVSFTTAGASTWTVPSKAAGAAQDVFYIYVTCVGGGGGGSGGPVSSSAANNGGGGGAGGATQGWLAVTPGQSIPFVVGAGGGGGGYQLTGYSGGSSSVGSTFTATGGAGAGGAPPAGGVGGQGSGGQTNVFGGNGGDGSVVSAQSPGGAGGTSLLGGGGRTASFYNAGVSNGRAPGSGGGGTYTNTQNTPGVSGGQGGNGADGYVSFQY